MPDLPQFEWALVPDSHRFVTKRLQESNYLQAVEGGIDSSHVSFLHSALRTETHVSTTLGLRSEYMWRDRAPKFTVRRTEYGLLIGARRDAEEDSYYWRLTQFLLPTATMIPGSLDGLTPLNGHVWVAIDDEQCWNYSISWLAERPLTAEEIVDLQSGNSIHAGVDPRTFRPVRNLDNEYLIDREQQRTTSYTGAPPAAARGQAAPARQGAVREPPSRRLPGALGVSDLAARRAVRGR
jgi:hypothetical protein